MSRLFYRCLLALHPPHFRRQFGPEMLGIFEDAALVEGTAALLIDALLSLLRQWFVRAGLWKAAVAAVGAAVQVIPPLWMGTRPWPRPWMVAANPGVPIEPDGLAAIACFVVGFLVMMVAAAVYLVNIWSARASRRPVKSR